MAPAPSSNAGKAAIWAAPCGSARNPAGWCPDSLARLTYGKDVITERHRHRYEFNNRYRESLRAAGLAFCGHSLDERLVEMIELPDHPWFLGCQFHPEFTSTPRAGHPLFRGFVEAAIRQRRERHEGSVTS